MPTKKKEKKDKIVAQLALRLTYVSLPDVIMPMYQSRYINHGIYVSLVKVDTFLKTGPWARYMTQCATNVAAVVQCFPSPPSEALQLIHFVT